jgi:hypothetical protein
VSHRRLDEVETSPHYANVVEHAAKLDRTRDTKIDAAEPAHQFFGVDNFHAYKCTERV